MINPDYGVPQHELNVLSCLLQDITAAQDIVDWRANPADFWLRRAHFQTDWIRDIFDTVLQEGVPAAIAHRVSLRPDNPAQAVAEVVVETMQANARQMAGAMDRETWDRVNDPAALELTYNTIYHLAQASWPANPQYIRHEAYVTIRAGHHSSAVEGVPFELAYGRDGTDEDRYKELAVIGAIIDDPMRAWQFHYTPSSRDTSPFWLQPGDFGDPMTAEIWDALVTGPDSAIALPAATDPSLTRDQRVQAMVEHIYARLYFNDVHRARHNPAAQDRIDHDKHRSVARLLIEASQGNFSPNPDNVAVYAKEFILEPSIPVTVDALAGETRAMSLGEVPLEQIALQLDTRLHTLDQLRERFDAAPGLADTFGAAPPKPAPGPAAANEEPALANALLERGVILSLMQNPNQLEYSSAARNLRAQDFTRPEHAYLLAAVRSLRSQPPAIASDPWVVARQVQKMAQYDGVPALDSDALHAITQEARQIRMPPAEDSAKDLIAMTARRTAHAASTAVQAASQNTRTGPKELIDYGREQMTHAAAEARQDHYRSMPDPSWHAGQRAGVA